MRSFPLPNIEFNQDHFQIEKNTPLYTGFNTLHSIEVQHAVFHDKNKAIRIQRELLIRRPAVGVLLYDLNLCCFLMIEQFRIGAYNDPMTAWQLEMVAGMVDDGETIVEAGVREIKEETGLVIQPHQLTPISSFYTSAGLSNEMYHLYSAEVDLSQAGGIHGAEDEGEDIRVHIIHLSHIDKVLTGTRIMNASAIIALQWLKNLTLNIKID